MNLISNIDFMDFYFNGHYLSEFGGIVGGTERLSKYPLLPSRSYSTDRSIGQDGVTVFNSYLEPRPFEVPIFFENIDMVGIRKIAGWLNTKSDEWFHYKNDTLKIKCTLDSNGTDLESLSGVVGGTSLKFIAHDPYYYELNETIHSYTGLTTTINSYSLTNTGNEVSFPLLSIWGTGTVTINVYIAGSSDLYKTCTITGLTSGVEINTKYRTCLTMSGGQLFNNFSGEFPVFPVGNYVLEIRGTISSLSITPQYKYI